MIPKLPQQPICNFCKSTDVVTCFLTEPREITFINPDTHKQVTVHSDEHWVGCSACAELARARDEQGLGKRSSESPHGAPHWEIGVAIMQSAMFWPGFNGAEHPLTDHEKEDN